MTTILVVEDEEAYRKPLEYSLKREGYEVIGVADGDQALSVVKSNHIDLVLLDLMLPGIPGTEVCRQVRESYDTPIIMVTAKDDVVDVVIGLELGADDYVTKPYRFRELLARITAVLRRTQDLPEVGNLLEIGPVTMDVDRHEVRVHGELKELPLREFELLEYFLRNPERVLTRGQVMDRVWGENWFGDPKTLDVHVKRLRSKIEDDPHSPKIIVTVRGLGYRIMDPK
ncbi:response regulator transcription factor [Varibaculum prostatecancerukia]|uniref:response regulator transcription factor n=1 Tax=Varibaculum prostatecancerukia TaxID=2811781 RepID=UPI001BFFDEF6|nr:response regulator transcription factor [Varibaculum prostatecancerukia]